MLRRLFARRSAGDDRTFMRRLREDKRGNALVLTAVAMIPIAGIVGSGVDISRAYLTKTRLQQACDAGVLGGRKVMGAAGLDSTVTAEVRKFVDYDFPQGTFGSSAFTVVPTAGANSAVDLTLATSVPTTLMTIFGISTIPISVSCTARQDFVNTDVMLVLDTTLSMNCLPAESATTYCPSEKSGSKIQALRAAVTSFYNALKPAQDQLAGQGLRLRYGIVPYSLTVNAGNLLRSTNPSWVNTTSSYRKCVTPSGQTCNGVGPASSVTHDSSFWSSWAGCIEERQTVSSIGSSSGYTPPANAYDLDVDTAPTSSATAWNAYDPDSETAKYNVAGLGYACPKSVQSLGTMSSVSDMNSYTAGLAAGGYTYHDLGMLWGARLLSPTGLWASNNPSSYNSFPVNRHLIFMTDGALEPDLSAYSAYGVEKFDKRVTGNGSSTSQYNSHLQRFRMMCNAVKGMNVNIWVIAFGTSSGTGLSTDLVNCANTPAQAFKADDQAALVDKFTQIGQAIGALRLSQ
ncbi:TadE/TadG family type IV pilus assembly protein [Sphingomonas ginkgonis]|nr:TadE/TadG family type IV pilus assembly protein [Sphingomonas ginkgonis]